MHRTRETRAAAITGAMRNHRREPGLDWVVTLGEETLSVSLAPDGGSAEVNDVRQTIETAWQPGDRLACATVDGAALVVKVSPLVAGFRMRYRGADLKVRVLSPRHAALASALPAKSRPDTSRLLLCPMPGLIVRIDVAEGDEVYDGQPLCMVEAMKMENVLLAERRARVVKVHASAGQSLAVDEVIMEFE
jgi:propionyl-CoA carboxylase alpha chain